MKVNRFWTCFWPRLSGNDLEPKDSSRRKGEGLECLLPADKRWGPEYPSHQVVQGPEVVMFPDVRPLHLPLSRP